MPNYWMIVSSAENFEISRELGFELRDQESTPQEGREDGARGPGALLPDGCAAVWGHGHHHVAYYEDRAPIWNSKKKGEEYPFSSASSPTSSLSRGPTWTRINSAAPEYVKRWPPQHCTWPSRAMFTFQRAGLLIHRGRDKQTNAGARDLRVRVSGLAHARLGPRDLPLFPLNVVLYPGMALPLRIFEERYKLMMQKWHRDRQDLRGVLIKSGKEVGGSACPSRSGRWRGLRTSCPRVEADAPERHREDVFRIVNIQQITPT